MGLFYTLRWWSVPVVFTGLGLATIGVPMAALYVVVAVSELRRGARRMRLMPPPRVTAVSGVTP